MALVLPDLPYPKNALEPYISARALEFHHDKHHNAYVVNANNLLKDTDMANEDIEIIIKKTAGENTKSGIFNNTAQVWNHTFLWNCMRPEGGGKPNGKIADLINRDFGSIEKLAEELKNAGATQFGSGWAWLILENDKLKVIKTANADTPIAHNLQPLLTIDVWEHAYYLDYQNRRPDYLTTFIDKLINWDFVNSQL